MGLKEEIRHIPQWIIHVWGLDITLNKNTLIMTWLAMGILILLSALATRRMALIPHRTQVIAEALITSFKKLVGETLGLDGKGYVYFSCSLFLFILFSNWLGVIPFLSGPTKDLNTTLGLGILGFIVAHASGIKFRGFRNYVATYFRPYVFMLPLTLIGELAKVVSISFRLFGNISGGAIIILVVSTLAYHLVFPPILNIFFGLFIGTVQALVFTLLTLVYISIQMR